MTLVLATFPQCRHFPSPSPCRSNGKQRIVALVSSFILASQTASPHHQARTKPPFSNTFLASSHSEISWVLLSRCCCALMNKSFCIVFSISSIFVAASPSPHTILALVSRRANTSEPLATSFEIGRAHV